jgi:hypothetical protein
MAVGGYKQSGGGLWPFADARDGTSWTLSTLYPGVAGDDQAYGVACRSTTECWAVGEAQSGSTYQPFSSRWYGHSYYWTPFSVPLAPSSQRARLRGVSCVATDSCKAVGWSVFGGTPIALVETLTP